MRAAPALVALHAAVFDLIPRALVVRAPTPETLDPAWLVSARRYVMPRPGLGDHWECVATPEPWLMLQTPSDGGPYEVALSVAGAAGVGRLATLFTAPHAERLAAVLESAARFDPEATTGLRRGAPTAPRPVAGREVATSGLGAEVLHALLRDAAAAADPVVALAATPLAPDDRMAWRRAVARTVDLWRSVWALPEPGPPPSAAELEVRLGAAYRRSLRLIQGRVDPAERGALRAEARALAAAYRGSGRARPRLLDVLTERLGLL